ncbi:MAG: tetratricopeptide repeat protein [Deltaproteobacteria bacterium]|nr:tetratricopeptide repeat protein [Deltaproteobacteria bacterium]
MKGSGKRKSGGTEARGGVAAGVVAAALVLVSSACYLPAMLWGGLIWDDRIWSQAPAVLEWSGLRTIWFAPSLIEREAHYWPLVYTTFWLEHKIWGLAPAGYHIVNVVLHAANTVFLWRILGRLAVPGAALAAAVFAVHPLHVESVAWIMERKDVLSALFYLGAVLAWLRFLERSRPWDYGLALLLFALGMLSKSIVVTLPVALLIIQWWREGRTTGKDLLRVAPFFAVGFLIAVADLYFYHLRWAEDLVDYSLVERVLIASRALWFYAGKLAWPVDLPVIYPLWHIDGGDPGGWLYLVAALGLAAALWFARGRIGRGPLAGAAFFAVTLSPTLGFVDFSYMQFSFVADRFQYLAGIGLMAVAAGAAWVWVAWLAERWGRRPARVAALLTLAVVLLLLGTRTWRHAGIFSDELVFNRHIIAHNYRARDAHRNLAAELFKLGRKEEALEHARIAVTQYPDCADCHAGLGAALIVLDRPEEAEAPLRRALELAPYNESALGNTAELFRRQGRHEEGLAAAERWRRVRPNAADPHRAMGVALGGLGRHGEAERHWRRVREIEPHDPAAAQNLAESIRKQGRYEEALEWYRTVLKVRPEFPLAHAAMGDVLFRLSRYDAAVDALTRAVELAPDLPHVPALLVLAAKASTRLGRHADAAEHYARAAAADRGYAEAMLKQAVQYARNKRYEEALDAFRTVLGLRPDDPAAHSNVGTMLYHLGRTDEALASFDRALSIDPDFENARNNRRALMQERRRTEDRPGAAPRGGE